MPLTIHRHIFEYPHQHNVWYLNGTKYFAEDWNAGCFLGSVTSHLFSILGSHHLYLFSIVSIHSTSFSIRKSFCMIDIVGNCLIKVINHKVLDIHDGSLAHWSWTTEQCVLEICTDVTIQPSILVRGEGLGYSDITNSF